MVNSITCKNCGLEALGDFCQNCGQRTKVDKVTFKETWYDFVDSVFAVNAPLKTTIKYLTVAPGELFTEFLDGKRKKFYRPVAFFVLMTLIYLVIRSLLNFDPFSDQSIISVGGSGPGEKAKLLTNAQSFMLQNLDKYLFLFVFSLALALKLFYRKTRTLAEFTAISFYIIGVYTIFLTLNMFVITYIDPQLQGLSIILFLVYVFYASLSFFKGNRILVIIKSFVLLFISFGFFALSSFALSLVIVYLKN